MPQKLELISFKTCPFVRRATITLLEKGIEFETSYVDLANKPGWFLEISPLGKVPLLRVGDEVLFESTVINEYLDEVYEPKLHPKDPLEKAKHRAWMAYADVVQGALRRMIFVLTKEEYESEKAECEKKLARLEAQLGHGPFFAGEKFSLVDSTMAPGLLYAIDIDKVYPLNLFEKFPKIHAWTKTLAARESVKNSVVPEMAELCLQRVRHRGSYLTQQ